MSQENVEIVRTSLEDFAGAAPGRARVGTGDSEAETERLIDTMAKLWDPEIEWDASSSPIPGLGGVYRGIDGVRRFWEEWYAAWEIVEFDYELVDAGEHVVMLLDQRMRGRHTGIEVPLGKYAQVATFRDGKMVRWKLYLTQAEALKAAGLSD